MSMIRAGGDSRVGSPTLAMSKRQAVMAAEDAQAVIDYSSPVPLFTSGPEALRPTGPTGLFRQVTALTKPQHDLLAKLHIDLPEQIIELALAPH
jgi:hypothetical protein